MTILPIIRFNSWLLRGFHDNRNWPFGRGNIGWVLILETIDNALYVYTAGSYFKLMTFDQQSRKEHDRVMQQKHDATSKTTLDPNERAPILTFEEILPQAPAAPPVFSRRAQMSPVRNQGSRGTCTVFGTLAQHEFNWSKTKDFSEQYLYWACKEANNQYEGTWIYEAWDRLKARGVCLETTWPYALTQPFPKWGGPDPPQSAHDQAASYKGKQNWWIDHTDINHLKHCIYELRYVVTVQVSVWWSCWPSSGVVTMPTQRQIQETEQVLNSLQHGGSSPSDGEHVICLCGYNDNTSRFEFKNSWGNNWGAQGYGSIPYDYIRNHARDSIVFQSA